MNNTFKLPARIGEAPTVGEQPPQLQFSDKSPDEIREELSEWVFSTIPKTIEHDTLISVPTTRAMWLDEKYQEAHQDAFMPPERSREYCHLHQDGSIHAVVSNKAEEEIILKKWGLRHPWHHKGVKEMLVYAPRNKDELEVLKKVIIESYQYASGDFNSKIQL